LESTLNLISLYQINNFLDKIEIIRKKRFVAYTLLFHIVILIFYFKLSRFSLINALLVFNALAILVTLIFYVKYIFKTPVYFQKCGVSENKFFKILVLTGIVIFLFCQIRIMRFNGIEPEMYPFNAYINDFSILDTIKPKKQIEPYRAGASGQLGKPIQARHFAINNYGFETIDGRGPIMPKYFKDYFKLIIKKQLSDKKDEDFFDWYWYDLSMISNNGKNELNFPLLSLANVKYLISNEYNQDFVNFSKNVIQGKRDYSGFPLYIYKLKDVFERGFLTKNVVAMEDVQDLLCTLSTQTVDALRKNAFFYKNEINNISFDSNNISEDLFKQNNIKLISYAPDKLVFDVSLITPAIVVISNNYYPKWHATINGIATKIFRANHAFQAVFVENTGSFKVVLEYKDKFLWICHIIMILGFLLINLTLLSNRICCKR
jgi:hypothetical protein